MKNSKKCFEVNLKKFVKVTALYYSNMVSPSIKGRSNQWICCYDWDWAETQPSMTLSLSQLCQCRLSRLLTQRDNALLYVQDSGLKSRYFNPCIPCGTSLSDFCLRVLVSRYGEISGTLFQQCYVEKKHAKTSHLTHPSGFWGQFLDI